MYATTTYTYQYDDNVVTTTDPGNHTTTSLYDFLGRYTQILYPDSTSILYSYNDTNNQVTVTNGRGYDTVYWYDWLSRLTKVEQEYAPGLFAVTSYQYDETGHVISFSDAENRTTNYVYGSFFGLTKTVYPDSTYEECQYDDVGNMISFSDANGNGTEYTYDDVYRLIHIQYQDQSTVSFMYDLNSNKMRMDDNAVNSGDYVEYSYDCWNRLTTETRHISQNTYTVSYQYDVANRLANLTYPDNMQILYFYDDLNRMKEIKRYVDGVNDEVLVDNVQYNAESLLNQFDYGNDLRALFTYDSRDRPLTVDIIDGETSYLGLGYTYDSNGNITALVNGWRNTNSIWHVETEMYSYDGLDQLISASCMSWSHTYSYDRVGNRTAKDGVIYTINIVNEVTALSDGTSFAYDSNGNRTQKTKSSDTEVYMYDYANRLTKVEKNSTILGECVYGGEGKRIQVTENNVTTTYVYSGLNVLYEENSIGTAVYIYGLTGRLAKRTTINQETNTFYYHNDYLGSTRLVTDNNKNILSAVTYHPFGESSIEEGLEDYLFNGKEKDATGLYYYGARYYDPDTGRFISRDPLVGDLESPQTLNRYTYCANNSLKYVDPTGLKIDVREHNRSEVEYVLSSSSSIDSGTAFLPIVKENMVLDVFIWGRSGNVVTGYGYPIYYYDDDLYNAENIPTDDAFFVAVFDDDYNATSFEYWNSSEINDLNRLSQEMKDVVGDENIQDLSNALRQLRGEINRKICTASDRKKIAGDVSFALGSFAGMVYEGLAVYMPWYAVIAGGLTVSINIVGGFAEYCYQSEINRLNNKVEFISTL